MADRQEDALDIAQRLTRGGRKFKTPAEWGTSGTVKQKKRFGRRQEEVVNALDGLPAWAQKMFSTKGDILLENGAEAMRAAGLFKDEAGTELATGGPNEFLAAFRDAVLRYEAELQAWRKNAGTKYAGLSPRAVAEAKYWEGQEAKHLADLAASGKVVEGQDDANPDVRQDDPRSDAGSPPAQSEGAARDRGDGDGSAGVRQLDRPAGDPNATLQGRGDGSTGREVAAPAPSAPPKLGRGEKGTGEIFKGADQPFNLAGETGTDWQRVEAAKAKAAADAAEAKAIADKAQTDMFAPKPEPLAPAPASAPKPTAAMTLPELKAEAAKGGADVSTLDKAGLIRAIRAQRSKAVQSVVDKVAPKVKTKVVGDINDLPDVTRDGIKKRAEAEGSTLEEFLSSTFGFYDPNTKTLYLMVDKLARTGGDITERTITHEVTHAIFHLTPEGRVMKAKLARQFWDVLTPEQRAGLRAELSKAGYAEKDMPEEAFARAMEDAQAMAKGGKFRQAWVRAVVWLKQWMRDHLGSRWAKLPWSNDDFREFFRKGNEALGQVNSQTDGGGIKFSREASEGKGKREQILATPAVELTGSEIADFSKISETDPLKPFRKKAIEWIQSNSIKPVTNAMTGWQIIISKQTIQDALAHGSGPKKIQAVAAVEEMLRRAVFLKSMADDKGRPLTYHYFATPLTINGERFIAGLAVREDANGRRFYDHELSTVESLDVVDSDSGAASAIEVGRSGPRQGYVKQILQEAWSGKLDSSDSESTLQFSRKATPNADQPKTPGYQVVKHGRKWIVEMTNGPVIKDRNFDFRPPEEDGWSAACSPLCGRSPSGR